ncbi:polyprenyl synthetase family protein [Lactobacillus sp. DCY120]|uniref:Polyprenyl synthetase family protein n=1 Tax=Bombilactobacillus apium TaxID=2675299 RepID=A0A850RBE3_9LACO|nr:polyprenyl synthetase family protein [Bombilactobacillus apium]NVY96636.1 polyprenyl synthetase family protein [Bombilactobacillus apium]
MINPIWKPFPKIEAQLQTVQTLILEQIRPLPQPLDDLVRQQVLSGGKMLRPACLLLFSQLGPDRDSPQILPAAAAIEILHLATLIHDDVIDDADLRRHVPTIQRRLGDRNAIYAGDYLMTAYFSLIGQVAQNREQILLNAQGMRKILLGELDQLQINRNLDATVKMYLHEVSGKTAQLLELSAQFGAQLGHAEARLIHHARFIGHNLGMAFQIEDDILDYRGQWQVGKPHLEDLKNGVYTIPLIYALQADQDQSLHNFLQEHPDLTSQECQQVAQWVEDLGGLTAAQELAFKYTQKAQVLIQDLPQGRIRQELAYLTRKLLKRQQ